MAERQPCEVMDHYMLTHWGQVTAILGLQSLPGPKLNGTYHQTSNISHTLVGIKTVYHSDVVLPGSHWWGYYPGTLSCSLIKSRKTHLRICRLSSNKLYNLTCLLYFFMALLQSMYTCHFQFAWHIPLWFNNKTHSKYDSHKTTTGTSCWSKEVNP